MLALIRHIVLIGVSLAPIHHLAGKISQTYNLPLLSPPESISGHDPMKSGRWLQKMIQSERSSVIISPSIQNPFTYHVLMNIDREKDSVIHVLAHHHVDDRWDRISSFYHYLSDAEIWSEQDLDLDSNNSY